MPTKRPGRVVGLLTTIGVLAEMVAPSPASAEPLNIALSKVPTPTYGTEHLPSPSQFSARVWTSATSGNVAYVGGEFTSLAPTTATAGAVDGQNGAPQPGFPKVDSGTVNVAAPDGRGGWFVGGSFPKLNGIQVNGLAHIMADGSLDSNFSPALVGPAAQPSKSFSVTALAVNGPWLYVGGEFTKFGARGTSKAQVRNHIARVSANSGTVDPGWDPDTGNNTAPNPVRSIAVSPDGSTVYFSGDFTSIGGQPRPGVGAFVADGGGNRVSPWVPPAGGVKAVGIAPDGSRIYLGTGNSLTAVDPNGAPVWNTAASGGGVNEMAVSRDGATVWLAGDFNAVGGQARNRLAAVHSDGTVDPDFNPAPDNGTVVSALTLSEDNSKVYFGGKFSKVQGKVRNNLAAVDAHTGAITPWDPNATGPVSSLTASGGLVYAGGTFTGLGATPRTYLGALDLTPGPTFGSALPFAPKLENIGSPNHPATVTPVVQALEVSPDGSKLFVAGNFDHINGVPRTNFAVLDLPGGDVDPAFDAGEPQGTVRAVRYEPALGLVYIGGDFDSIAIPGSARMHRPDNDQSCGTPAHKDSQLLSNNRCIWARSKLAALDAATGVVDPGFQGPTATGSGLVGQGGKTCSGGGSGCGTGAVLAIGLSPDKHQLYASGSFSELNNSGHRNTIFSIYNDGPNRGKLTPWQPQAPAGGIPVFDIKVDPGTGWIFGAGGGGGGRAIRWDPKVGAGGISYNEPAWTHLFDGDARSVDISDSVGYWGGHFDFLDGGAYRRKHAAAIDFNNNVAQNWDPEFDTNEGVFSVEVVPHRLVIYGGNFSRVNRRP
ncbi:MAG TPA: delta-60 repeat domain-containing protein, partial [Acidimicrobiia bacterium]|nr:delta-60 repeat domain-containing protein [Acidimicrobiia bacterium]